MPVFSTSLLQCITRLFFPLKIQETIFTQRLIRVSIIRNSWFDKKPIIIATNSSFFLLFFYLLGLGSFRYIATFTKQFREKFVCMDCAIFSSFCLTRGYFLRFFQESGKMELDSSLLPCVGGHCRTLLSSTFNCEHRVERPALLASDHLQHTTVNYIGDLKILFLSSLLSPH